MLAVLGAGDPHYRGYALAALAENHEVVLVDAAGAPWAEPLVRSVLPVDSRAPAEVARALRASGWTVDAVLTYDELSVRSAAAVAEELGLRQISPRTAERCRDKRKMRKAFAACGLSSPTSIEAGSCAEVVAAAELTGYPLVVKPVDLAGSIGVVLVTGPEEVPQAYRSATSSGHAAYGSGGGSVLVEEYVDGPEISVECLAVDGAVTPVAVTRKRLAAIPYFEECGHVVSPYEPVENQTGVVELAVAAHRALGLDWAVTHTEIRLAREGPRLIEVAARAAGDLIPLLVRMSTGVDLMTSLAAALTGRTPPPAAAPEAVAAGVRFFYPPRDLVFREVDSPLLASAPSWLTRFVREVTPGTPLRLPPRGFLNRFGHAIVTGADAAQCDRRLDRLEDSIEVIGDPLPPPR